MFYHKKPYYIRSIYDHKRIQIYLSYLENTLSSLVVPKKDARMSDWTYDFVSEEIAYDTVKILISKEIKYAKNKIIEFKKKYPEELL